MNHHVMFIEGILLLQFSLFVILITEAIWHTLTGLRYKAHTFKAFVRMQHNGRLQ
jgi:hypothetical protein